jgi:hypothetical protein
MGWGDCLSNMDATLYCFFGRMLSGIVSKDLSYVFSKTKELSCVNNSCIFELPSSRCVIVCSLSEISGYLRLLSPGFVDWEATISIAVRVPPSLLHIILI